MKKIVPVGKIVDEKDDFELCEGIDSSISAGYGDKVMLPEAPIEMQVVALTRYVGGIWENGGFEYLLEKDFPEDDAYERIADAFRRIGCDEAAAAIEKVVALFPGNRVPHDNKKREAIFMSIPEGLREGLNDDFGRGTSGRCARLAAYIRSHRGVFIHLPPATIICSDEDPPKEVAGD
jgi:hypothetical protein